jgi:molybdopterin-synthase adenylyltransferase
MSTKIPRHVLVFTQEMFKSLKRDLLADAPLESAAYALARPVFTPEGSWRLIVYEIISIDPSEYLSRSSVSIELSPRVVAASYQRARSEKSSLVLIHTHPFDGVIEPSPRDLAGEAIMRPFLHQRMPTLPHVRLIIGMNGLHAALLEPSGKEVALDVISVGRDVTSLFSSDKRENIAADIHDRQIRAFGTEGQQILSKLRVAIVGLGGTGSVVAQQLAHLGVGSLLLIDPDKLEKTNLNRVVGSRVEDVGLDKVTVAERMIRSINSKIQIKSLNADICDSEIARQLLDSDFFFCCTDSHGSRVVLTQIAYQYLVPGIDLGVIIRAENDIITHINGRVQMLAPGLACLICQNLLDPEQIRRDLMTEKSRLADPYIVGGGVPQPAVISINSATASMATTMFLSAVTGIPFSARHQQLRFEMGMTRAIESDPQLRCPLCSIRGTFLRGDSIAFPGRKNGD